MDSELATKTLSVYFSEMGFNRDQINKHLDECVTPFNKEFDNFIVNYFKRISITRKYLKLNQLLSRNEKVAEIVTNERLALSSKIELKSKNFITAKPLICGEKEQIQINPYIREYSTLLLAFGNYSNMNKVALSYLNAQKKLLLCSCTDNYDINMIERYNYLKEIANNTLGKELELVSDKIDGKSIVLLKTK